MASTKTPFFSLLFILLSYSPLHASDTVNLLNHDLARLFLSGTVNLQNEYNNNVILAVNTASGCGYTSQFEQLESLYQKYKEKGLVVLAFPSNDFFQEAKSDKEIVEFCKLNYGVSFPIFQKSHVKGDKANPFYQSLAQATNGDTPQWNFFKYLIDKDQKVVGFFSSQDNPLGGEIENQIAQLLN